MTRKQLTEKAIRQGEWSFDNLVELCNNIKASVGAQDMKEIIEMAANKSITDYVIAPIGFNNKNDII